MFYKIKQAIDFRIFQLTGKITHAYTIRLLRKVVYWWVLVNTLILLPASPSFWGENALMPKIDSVIINEFPLIYLLNTGVFAPYYLLFIVLQIFFLVLGILCVYPRIVSLIIYWLTINLDNKAYVILDGGNNLIHLILLYLIFIDPSTKRNKFKVSFLNQLNNTVSNLGFYMIRLQIVIVYLVSGLAKVAGPLWQNGTALYYTLNIDEYTHPLAKKIISEYPLFTVMGSYATVIYQVSFPWLVWNKKVRTYLLTFGTFIHIQISFVMGLFMFGLAVAVSYFSFIPDETAKKILNLKSNILRRFRKFLQTASCRLFKTVND